MKLLKMRATGISKSEITIISILLLTLAINRSWAILTSGSWDGSASGGNNDFTANPQFGCHWFGGQTPGVNCTCRYDAQELYITDSSLPSFNDNPIFEINGCERVRFGTKSIAEIRNLREINLKNINTLVFEESSLIWYGYRDRNDQYYNYDMTIPSLKIHIENSHIEQISRYTFQGRINTINLNNVTISNIDAFAFNALAQTQRIIFQHVKLENVNLQAFKKFTTETFEFDHVESKIIPSRFIDITVSESFAIKNCIFDTVRPSAFIITNPSSVQIVNTKIGQLDGEAFRIATRGNVIFRHNQFDVINDGAFRGIRSSAASNFDDPTSTPTIFFDSNIFTTLTRDSLGTSDDVQVNYLLMNINKTCECRDIDRYVQETEFHGQIYCLYNSEFTTIEEFKTNMCSIIQSYSPVIIIVGVVATLAFIICTVLFVYYKQVYRSKKYGNTGDSKENGKNMSLIVPDGRTYRETELHVIVERADLLTTDL